MSGICGQFNLDNAPVAAADLGAMTAMLEKRGPERTGRWQDGSAGLGHTLLATTPELKFERQPFKHADTGCVITADVRLDNRDELLDAFGLLAERDSIGDAELILLAYLEWGEDCLDRLLGDFAFAIWDPRHQKLFASDARAILVLPQVPYKINEGRVADLLVPELQWMDYTSTFFEDVYRLPPGHKATVTRDGINVAEYWKPQPGPDLGPMSDDDYAQGFLEVFTRSVDARLRTASGNVGSMLSGGMDSGSVVAVAQEILSVNGESLRTFSAVRRRDDGDVDCAESRAIYAAVTIPSISPTLIYPDSLEDSVEQLILGNEEPFDGEFMILKSIYLAAKNLGTSVVLDGGAGDVVLGEGSYITRLLRKGKISLAMAEIAAENRFWLGGSFASSFSRYGRAAIVPEVLKKRLRGLRDRHNIRGHLKSSLISRDLAARVGIEDRFERMRQTFDRGSTSDYAVERSNTLRPNLAAGRERYARIAAAMSTEARDPFLDRRVVDYCTRLPGRMRLKNGWPKIILREIMADKLPDEVLWCRGKPHLGWLFNGTVTRLALRRGDLNETDLGKALQDHVDSAALASAWHRLHNSGDTEQIDSAYQLSVWLRESANRPVVPV